MEGCPEALESENPAPWQRRLTSITLSEAAASGKQHASAGASEDLSKDRREALSSAPRSEKRDSPPSLTFSEVVQGEEPPAPRF